MAVRQIDNQDTVFLQSGSFNHFNCPFHTFFCHFLPAFIECFQIFWHHHCLSAARCIEQFQCSFCRIKSSTSIDTWTDDKTNMIGIQIFHIDSSTFKQCLQPFIFRLFQHFQTRPDKNPVLSCQIYHIADRSDRDILDQIFCFCRIHLQFLQQYTHQFIGNPCSAKLFIWIIAVFLMWIDHRICCGDLINANTIFFFKFHFMMIRHDHRHPFFFSICNLLNCRDSIITGEDRINPILVCTVN